ncbi:hypothetical protein [Aliidiomarina quisquiliarum]|uniref:hypothetical protein n=1 Tax=Aliidiomarina quisquiliarum TaxID=2938947 RepID=UPI00208EEBAE|nr:hypothetical protein [Aliidiomarina quisquiliarum]MCO4322013.1 hypothetical protein [Aliidiomarina quisquiliarum]
MLYKCLAKTCLAIATLATLSACSSGPEDKLEANVFIDNNTLVLHGSADKAAVQSLLSLANNNPEIKHFRVRSAGGDPMAAMNWGYHLFKHEFSLEVEGYCLDSCANYFFPAAYERILQKNAIVAWSGGAKHENWVYQWQSYSLPGMRSVVSHYLNASLRREIRFYQRIMVYQKLTMFGFDSHVGCMESGEYRGFYYTVADLLMLGVGRVSREGVSWDKTFSHYPSDYCLVKLDPVEMLKR